MSTKHLTAVALALVVQKGFTIDLVPQTIHVNGNTTELRVPVNTRVEFLAEFEGARFPTVGPQNELIVGSNNSSVFRLRPPYTKAEVLVNVGSRTHSVAYRQNKLYFASTDGVYEGHYAGSTASVNPEDLTKIVELPTGGHSSRTILVGPGDALYVSIGITGNCSNEYLAGTTPDYPTAKRRGGVWRIDESGPTPALSPYSSGLRNPIGIAFHPTSSQLWATNAGADNLGYKQPREVLARLSQDSWHGMPWFQFIEGAFVDGQCIDTNTAPRAANEAIAPAITFDARSTPLGIAFVAGGSLGDTFRANALAALHGSWATNPELGGGPETRRPPKVVMVKFSGANPTSVEDVITGFQRPDGSRFARPAGAIMGPDGNFYFTSDGGQVQGLFRLRSLSRRHAGAMINPIMLLLLDE